MKLSDSISGESKTRVMDFESSDNASSDELRRLKRQLHQQLVANIDLAAMGTMSRDELRREVRRVADDLCLRSSNLLSKAEREKIVGEVLDETFGLGPLEPLMNNPTISDILINGYRTVYVERHGQLEKAGVSFNDE